MAQYPEVTLARRRINDDMGNCAEQTVKTGSPIKGAKVNALGPSFKEDVPDLSNSKAWDLILELRSSRVQMFVHNPVAYACGVMHRYEIELCDWNDFPQANAMVFAMAQQALSFKSTFDRAANLQSRSCFLNVEAKSDTSAPSDVVLNESLLQCD